jgi:hypothetical protein
VETVILIGCVSRKTMRPAPARDLYVSDLFRKRRSYAEASGRPWLIVSALYGVLDPDETITPYDFTLKRVGRRERAAWGELVASQLEQRLGVLAGRTFELHAGVTYVEPIRDALSTSGARLVTPLEGLGIGMQLHWYSSLLSLGAAGGKREHLRG